MKKTLVISCLLLLLFITIGCSSTDDSNDPPEASEFAMTAVLNGTLYEMQNPFGTNEAVNNIFSSYYPDEDYVQFMGRVFVSSGFDGIIEISIWLNRNDIAVGTYQVDSSTYNNDTHIDLLNNTQVTVSENTISGSITITEADLVNKFVKGTFEFNTVDDDLNLNFEVTNGTFNYKYDVE